MADVTFREPFSLKLHVDRETSYEETFEKIPYVQDGAVFLFKDDEFGINIELSDGAVVSVAYAPVLADLTFRFSQRISRRGGPAMVLEMENHTDETILMDAMMTVPGDDEILRAIIFPVSPGIDSQESWNHPIVQLVLYRFRTLGSEQE
ncbi:MAG: hypothetical protein FWF02_07460 [Micrococcales bacterium]|nr:hypothetical protein [Micrococcales bacterium]MCL2667529.1 hypothetical protein [Micrococcales bacterium]